MREFTEVVFEGGKPEKYNLVCKAEPKEFSNKNSFRENYTTPDIKKPRLNALGFFITAVRGIVLLRSH